MLVAFDRLCAGNKKNQPRKIHGAYVNEYFLWQQRVQDECFAQRDQKPVPKMLQLAAPQHLALAHQVHLVTGLERDNTGCLERLNHQRKKNITTLENRTQNNGLTTRDVRKRIEAARKSLRSFTSCYGEPVPECKSRNFNLLATHEIQNYVEKSSARHHHDVYIHEYLWNVDFILSGPSHSINM